eukprot:tig00021680_g23047.t1
MQKGHVHANHKSKPGHGPDGQLCTWEDKKHHQFTIVCKPGMALKYKDGKLGFGNLLVSDAVYKNYQKGETYTDEELKGAFGTSNLEEVAKQILEKGELKLSAAEQKEKIEKVKKEIISHLHKHFLDVRSNAPLPERRLEEAFEQLKIKVDPDTPFREQLTQVVKAINPTMAIAERKIEGTLVVPSKFVSQAKTIVAKHAAVGASEFSEAGLTMELSVLPGEFDLLVGELHKVMKNDFEWTAAAPAGAGGHEESAKGKGKGGKGKERAGGAAAHAGHPKGGKAAGDEPSTSAA